MLAEPEDSVSGAVDITLRADPRLDMEALPAGGQQEPRAEVSGVSVFCLHFAMVLFAGRWLGSCQEGRPALLR